MTTKHRAEPLSREARRASILEAVIPLLIENGANVTTAQMANAAGIAEGTIFRAFDDKAALLQEAAKSCFDPEPTLTRISNIERALPFEIKLRKAAAIILDRSARVHALVAVLRSMPPTDHRSYHDAHKLAIEANSLILSGLTRIFQDEASGLAVEPARAAAAFRGLLFAVNSPFSDPDEMITADQAIEILLHGVCTKDVS